MGDATKTERSRYQSCKQRWCGVYEFDIAGCDFKVHVIPRECIRQSKPMPDFARTDSHFVWLTLHGEIQDSEFLRFLEEIGQERMAAFTIEDFLVVDLVHREQSVPDHLKPRLEPLLEQGIIERVGRGRGTRLLLSRRFYRHLGKGGVYTRKRGLDRETNKALLLKHIRDSGREGATLEELRQVLPSLSSHSVQWLVRQLKSEGLVRVEGKTRAGRWIATVPAKSSGEGHERARDA